MRKLSVSTLVTLDGVVQDPGGFGETEDAGWANAYFDDEAGRLAYEHVLASDVFLLGRETYELFKKHWTQVHEGDYAVATRHVSPRHRPGRGRRLSQPHCPPRSPATPPSPSTRATKAACRGWVASPPCPRTWHTSSRSNALSDRGAMERDGWWVRRRP